MQIGVFDPDTSGHHAEYNANLADYLRSRGNTVTMIGGELAQRHSTIWLWTRLMRTVWSWHKFDVVHLTYADPLPVPLSMILLVKRLLCPNVDVFITVHWYTSVVSTNKHSVYRSMKKKCFVFNARRVSGIFVHGNVTKYHLGLLSSAVEQRLILIPYGAPGPVKSSLEKREEPLSLSVLFFGGLRRDKGIEVLAQALREMSLPIKLIIAGRPIDYTIEEIESLVQGLDVELNLKHIPDGLVSDFFVRAKTLVLPYRSSFGGQSGPLTIAASHGIPIVGTDVGEVGDTIRSYGLGEVADADDEESLKSALIRVLTYSGEELDRIRTNAMNYSNTHSWSVMSNLICESYINEPSRIASEI